MPLSDDKKLYVVYRIEPGCLGPRGPEMADKFSRIATESLVHLDEDWVHWQVVPRFDKSLAEMEYRVNQKLLSHDQADRYLQVFGQNLDEFEEHLHERIGHLIEEFLGRS